MGAQPKEYTGGSGVKVRLNFLPLSMPLSLAVASTTSRANAARSRVGRGPAIVLSFLRGFEEGAAAGG